MTRIVLDLDNPIAAAKTLRKSVQCESTWSGTPTVILIADQIEAQTRPPRIPEPKDIGASVSARQMVFTDKTATWTRFSTILLANWIDAAGRKRRWTDLIDPTLIREGVS